MKFTGKDLINLGYPPGKYFKEMIEIGQKYMDDPTLSLENMLIEFEKIYNKHKVDIIPLQEQFKFLKYIDGESEQELQNIEAVENTMAEVVKTPTVKSAAIMPDACPAGPIGTIPVGGIVAAENAIHPGMHSADICCSMFLTTIDWIYAKDSIKWVMDMVQDVTHFGPSGRIEYSYNGFIPKDNPFLNTDQMKEALSYHMGTQGDGNHFFYVGKRKSDGRLTFVTHHGSRKPGALLYKAGMKVAEKFRQKYSPATKKQNAWIPADSEEGFYYWEALQFIRNWTKENHRVLHKEILYRMNMIGYVIDQFWNEHNFVFKRDNLFYHAKGATPVYDGFSEDQDAYGRSIIPLNMAEPILIVKNHPNNKFGFAPHGAGRNFSRTQHKKNVGDFDNAWGIVKQEVPGLDIRFYSGNPDISELPSAYKNANEVKKQIEKYQLAVIVDEINPLGCIMAGEFDRRR